MATRAGNSSNEPPRTNALRTVPQCAICAGIMMVAYERYGQTMCVCLDCHTTMTVPGGAWQVASRKRETKTIEPAERRRRGRRASDQQLHSS